MLRIIMHSKFNSLYVFLAISTLLSGCDKAKQALGQGKEAPDEFAVFQRAPLSLPPDYGLKPPQARCQTPANGQPKGSCG